MDGSRFDRLTREFGAQVSRRSLIARALGLGGAAAVAIHAAQGTEAARRGFSGPRFPTLGQSCTLPADCPPCQCTGPQTIVCSTCDPDRHFCFSVQSPCSGCCVTIDDVAICDDDCTP